MNKVVFLDRDGTLNEDYGYVHEIQEFKLKPNVIEGLSLLKELGFLFVIITNQSGIARGYFDSNQVDMIHAFMLTLFKENDIDIKAIYVCPHLNGCDCRKPKTKLYYEAAKEFNISYADSYAIGDRIRDLAICEKEPVTGILLSKQQDTVYQTAKDLLDAARWIQKNMIRT